MPVLKVLVYNTTREGVRLRDKAKTGQTDVEDKERVHGQRDPVLHYAAASEDADAGRERPEAKHTVDGYPYNGWHAQCAEQRRNDKREERVADDAD